MNKKKIVKYLALGLSVMMMSSIFSGCGGSEKSDQKVIKYNINSEPKTIDPAKNNELNGGTIVVNAFEGLYKYDDKSEAKPAVAESYDLSKDGLHYTFHLRKDSKWSDGKAVTAKDFEYAWKRALNPDTAAEYAYQLYYIKNGQGYNESKSSADKRTPGVKTATKDEVGVKAIDDYTLKVDLEAPTPYFLSLVAFPTYLPVREDVVNKDPNGWATKPESYVCNGPFKMKEWKPKDSINFVKNENYRDYKNIKIDEIQFKMVEKATSALSAFKTDDLDIIETPPLSETPNLLKDGTAKASPALGTYFLCMNISDKANAKVLKDARVRKALSLSINRRELIDNVTKSNQLPATSFVPTGVVDSSGNEFKNKDYYRSDADIEQAKKLLAEAGYPDGKGFPKVTLLYNNGGEHQNIVQAVQDMWRKNLNVVVDLKSEEWKVFQTSRTEKNYDISRHGWIGDYVDPMTFLDMWVTNGGNNDAGFSNKEYDNLIKSAKSEQNQTKRMSELHKAEDILMNEMPIIPLYYYNYIVCKKDYVKGVNKSILGFIMFENADIDKK